jgi:hypothetical protein
MDHFGGRCGETMELEGREPTINTAPHLPRHSNGINEKEEFWFTEHWNLVTRYDTTQRWPSTQLWGSMTARVRPKVGTDRVCMFIV